VASAAAAIERLMMYSPFWFTAFNRTIMSANRVRYRLRRISVNAPGPSRGGGAAPAARAPCSLRSTTRYRTRCTTRRAAVMWSIWYAFTPRSKSAPAASAPSGLPAVAPMAMIGKRRSPAPRV
jgi:hypothetical protein